MRRGRSVGLIALLLTYAMTISAATPIVSSLLDELTMLSVIDWPLTLGKATSKRRRTKSHTRTKVRMAPAQRDVEETADYFVTDRTMTNLRHTEPTFNQSIT